MQQTDRHCLVVCQIYDIAGVAQILVGLINKNLESDTRVNAKDQRSSQPLEISFAYISSQTKGQYCLQNASPGCVCLHQTSDSLFFFLRLILPYIILST